MTDKSNHLFAGKGEISFYDLLCIMITWKSLYILSLVLCLVGSLVFLSFNKPEYSARLLIRPLSAEDNPSASQRLSIGGGLLGQVTDENIALYIGTMRSVEMLERGIKEDNLAQLLQPYLWDAENKVWVEPSGFASSVRGALNSLIGRSIERNPEDPAIVGSALANKLYISRADNKMTPDIYEVMIKDQSPDTALRVLRIIHQQTVDLIRENKVRNAEILLSGLRKRYAEATEVTYRMAFLDQIMQQERRLLMLRDPSYPVIDMVDPPSFAAAPYVIPLKIGLAGGIIAGIILGASLNLFLYFVLGRRKKNNQSARPPSQGGNIPGDQSPQL